MLQGKLVRLRAIERDNLPSAAVLPHAESTLTPNCCKMVVCSETQRDPKKGNIP